MFTDGITAPVVSTSACMYDISFNALLVTHSLLIAKQITIAGETAWPWKRSESCAGH